MGASPVRICRQCRNDLLPRRAVPVKPSEIHRGENTHRVEPTDPRAERIRNRKQRKAEQSALRKQLRVEGILSTVRTFLLRQSEKAALRNDVASEECERCLKLQKRDAA